MARLTTQHVVSRAAGALLVVIVVSCVVTLPWTTGRAGEARNAPRRYEAQQLEHMLLPPAWAPHRADERARRNADPSMPAYVLGTDRLGRSVAVRCLAGGGISLAIGLSSALIAVLIGTTYGVTSGWLGGRVDALLMRIVEIVQGLPAILLIVLLAVASEGILEHGRTAVAAGDAAWWLTVIERHPSLVNIVTLLVAIGGVSWLTMARVIRGQVLSLREQPFMESARATGVRWPRLVFRHLLPNLVGPIVVYATLTVPTAILSESFLSFLGIGVGAPLPSWGNLAADGLGELNVVRMRWWLLLWPCSCIAITLLSLNFMGESLRERLDPRRRVAAVRRPSTSGVTTGHP